MTLMTHYKLFSSHHYHSPSCVAITGQLPETHRMSHQPLVLLEITHQLWFVRRTHPFGTTTPGNQSLSIQPSSFTTNHCQAINSPLLGVAIICNSPFRSVTLVNARSAAPAAARSCQTSTSPSSRRTAVGTRPPWGCCSADRW